jgi:predicted lipoprotein
MRVVGLLLVTLGCSGKPAPDERESKPAPPSPVIDAGAPVDGPELPAAKDGMPGECVRYQALAGTLATCTALGAQRELLRAEFEASWKAWSLLPEAERGKAAEACKAAARAIEVACPATGK